MFLRFMYLYLLFMYEYLCFNSKNLFCRRLLGKKPYNRVELVKRITKHLENINIVYVKIFQSLCLEKDILNEDEKDYLMKYTDNVPYSNSDIDFKVLDKLEEEFGVYVENRIPINSGIVGVVFKGKHKKDNDRLVVVKLLKRDILEKYLSAFNDFESLTRFISLIPILNNINASELLNDSKESIIYQTDFSNECKNIEIFYNKYKNSNEFVIPYVYKDITERIPSIIVMEDIKGLVYNDIKNYSKEIKYEFAKLLQKFGALSILVHSCINSDCHAGNIFFYINEDNTNKKKYQMGIIDFGLCYFPSQDNQSAYHKFFYDIQINQKYDLINTVLPVLIKNKCYYDNLTDEIKLKIFISLKEIVKKFSRKNFDINFFIQLSRLFRQNNLLFTKEFNNLCLSISSTNSLGLSLYDNIYEIHAILIHEINHMNKVLEIE